MNSETDALWRCDSFALLVYGTFVFNSITRFPAWTNLHPDHEVVVVPADYAAEEDSLLGSGGSENEEDDADDEEGPRPVVRGGPTSLKRAGSASRGEHSTLLKKTTGVRED